MVEAHQALCSARPSVAASAPGLPQTCSAFGSHGPGSRQPSADAPADPCRSGPDRDSLGLWPRRAARSASAPHPGAVPDAQERLRAAGVSPVRLSHPRRELPDAPRRKMVPGRCRAAAKAKLCQSTSGTWIRRPPLNPRSPHSRPMSADRGTMPARPRVLPCASEPDEG